MFLSLKVRTGIWPPIITCPILRSVLIGVLFWLLLAKVLFPITFEPDTESVFWKVLALTKALFSSLLWDLITLFSFLMSFWIPKGLAL